MLERAGEPQTKEPIEWPEADLLEMGLPTPEARISLRQTINDSHFGSLGAVGRPELTPEIVEIMRCVEDVAGVSRNISVAQVVDWALREAAYLFPLDWMRVNNIGKLPGSILGSVRSGNFTQGDWDRMHAKLKELKIEGLIVIGGLRELELARQFAESTGLCIVAIPATIDNDIPGTIHSIGADTALNTICEAADRVMATAAATYRVFVIRLSKAA